MIWLDDRRRYLLSPTDLAKASSCEYGFLCEVRDRLNGTKEPGDRAEEDLSMAGRAISLGLEHEGAYARSLQDHFGVAETPEAGRGVYEVTRTPGEHRQALIDRTLRALESGVDAVLQGAVGNKTVFGYADFLIKIPNPAGYAYMVSDTKIARGPKPTALMQVGLYADVLNKQGIPIHPEVALVLGRSKGFAADDFGDVRFPTWDVVAATRLRLARLQEVLSTHVEASVLQGVVPHVDWNDDSINRCGTCEHCVAAKGTYRDLLLVANLTRSQRLQLRLGGVTTIDQLAELDDPDLSVYPDGGGDSVPPGTSSPQLSSRSTLDRLHRQARLQVKRYPNDNLKPTTDKPLIEVFAPDRLALPPSSPGDIFFDFEGDPLWWDAGPDGSREMHASSPKHRWGLEYLFGMWRPALGNKGFTYFWADDRAEEADALTDFCNHLRAVLHEHPDMHVYHYAPYEPAALKRLAGRHEREEDFVDHLLRTNRFIDLYKVVRDSMRVSEESYSIKYLEPLYRLTPREGVTNAADSVEQFARYQAASGAEREALRQGILRYNEDDCVSTQQLRDFLCHLWRDSGRPEPSDSRDTSAEPSSTRSVDNAPTSLQEYRKTAAEAQARAVRMLASTAEFWTREDKPFWWSHFDRLTQDAEDWGAPDEWLRFDEVTVVQDWHTPPRAKKPRRRLKATGQLADEGSQPPRTLGYLLYPYGATPVPAWQRGLHQPRFTAVAVDSRFELASQSDGAFSLEFDEWAAKSEDGYELPTALPIAASEGPVPHISLTGAARDQVNGAAQAIAHDREPDFAAWHILTRRPPRMRQGHLAEVRNGDYSTAITDSLLRLDSSYLAVQGPPGTGKTHQATQVIAALLADPHRYHIGVVAQSHAVVHNLLRRLLEVGVDGDSIATYDKKATGDLPWHVLKKSADMRAFLEGPQGRVVGGTAWDFTNLARLPEFTRGVDAPPLDLLVVEEAGQFSLAMTVVAATCAKNVLLLGDPQQLPQVTKGTHPQPVDDSALGWLAQGATLPPECGYFLATTHRMHPALTRTVSQYAYEGRLESHECTVARQMHDSRGDLVPPGVLVEAVEHEGRTTDSAEESQRIVELAKEALTWTWSGTTCGGGSPRLQQPRRMTQADVLVVAPYNGQVERIRRELTQAGLPDIRVGTVDKMQGREAPVVLVSMTVSSPEDAPRGLDFVLSRNRVNVAISRAQYRATVVRSTRLTDTLPNRPETFLLIGAIERLSEDGADG